MEFYYTASHKQVTYLACWKLKDSAQEFKPRHYTPNIPQGCRSLSVIVRKPQKVIRGDWFTYLLQMGNVIISAQAPDFGWVTFTDRQYAAAFFNMCECYDASVLPTTVCAFERGTTPLLMLS